AIFWLTRPATIIRSAWRGDARNGSMPKRAMSKRPAAVPIISMAQQASPNVAGHSDPLRAYPATVSTVDSRMPLGSCSSRPISRHLPAASGAPPRPASPRPGSRPTQPPAPPLVGVGHRHVDDEQPHRRQPEVTERIEVHRPRVEEDDLDVEDDEQHR